MNIRSNNPIDSSHPPSMDPAVVRGAKHVARTRIGQVVENFFRRVRGKDPVSRTGAQREVVKNFSANRLNTADLDQLARDAPAQLKKLRTIAKALLVKTKGTVPEGLKKAATEFNKQYDKLRHQNVVGSLVSAGLLTEGEAAKILQEESKGFERSESTDSLTGTFSDTESDVPITEQLNTFQKAISEHIDSIDSKGDLFRKNDTASKELEGLVEEFGATAIEELVSFLGNEIDRLEIDGKYTVENLEKVMEILAKVNLEKLPDELKQVYAVVADQVTGRRLTDGKTAAIQNFFLRALSAKILRAPADRDVRNNRINFVKILTALVNGVSDEDKYPEKGFIRAIADNQERVSELAEQLTDSA